MKVICYINLNGKITKLEEKKVEPFMIFITRREPIGWDERGIEEAR